MHEINQSHFLQVSHFLIFGSVTLNQGNVSRKIALFETRGGEPDIRLNQNPRAKNNFQCEKTFFFLSCTETLQKKRGLFGFLKRRGKNFQLQFFADEAFPHVSLTKKLNFVFSSHILNQKKKSTTSFSTKVFF